MHGAGLVQLVVLLLDEFHFAADGHKNIPKIMEVIFEVVLSSQVHLPTGLKEYLFKNTQDWFEHSCSQFVQDRPGLKHD